MPAIKRAKKNPPQPNPTTSPEATIGTPSKPASGASESTPVTDQTTHGPANPPPTEQDKASPDNGGADKKPTNESQTSLNVRQSWYGGTWPRTPAKAAPVTQLAKESISGGSEAVARATENVKAKADSLRSVKRAPSLYMSPGISTRSLPSTGTATKVSVSTPKLGLTESHDGTEEAATGAGQSADVNSAGSSSNPIDLSRESGPQVVGSNASAAQSEAAPGDGTAWGMSSWIPGFRRADQQAAKPSPGEHGQPATAETPETVQVASSSASVPVPSTSQAIEAGEAEEDSHRAILAQDSIEKKPASVKSSSRPKSWFGLWTGDAGAKDTKGTVTSGVLQDEGQKPMIDTDLAIRAAAPARTEELDAGQDEQTPEERAAATSAALADGNQAEPSKAARWSWWGRSAPGTDEEATATSPPSSRTTAPAAEDTEMTDAGASTASTTSRKRERPASSEVPNNAREDKISKQSADGKTSATAAVNVMTDDGSRKGKEKPIEHAHDPTNLLLPTLKQTYRAAENPGLIERLAQYFFTSKAEAPKHVHLTKEPTKVKHAIAIGVHGYFPAPFIRTMIGQPKGTSVKFAHMASEAIRDWCKKRGWDPKIDRVVLEGEGKIDERIDLLWKLLIRHIELIREADFVLVACHSQGVPVAVQLVAKLIKFGVLAGKRVGICAMAGVNLGPFPEYKSRWIGGSAGELFDFASPDSQVSTDYQNSLAAVLKSGVKMVLVGSIDDQLVSMESATFGNVEHPGIYRAVFINGQVHAPTFVVHLVGFALKLRNLGIPDHGLVRELSNSLAGSFTGDGHSRLYEDSTLYDMAIEFALETTPCVDVPVKIRPIASTTSVNPYILPFAMRGVLEEDFVKSDLHSEMTQLLSQFDDWKPATKQLRDVKFRLEGVRSKI